MKPESKLAELAKRKDRDAWAAHYANCFECKAAKDRVCETGRPLLAAALVEMEQEPRK